MDTLSLITDMFRHTAWADALVFSAIFGRPEVEQDEFILAKLRHLHVVQKIFLDVWREIPLNPQEADALDSQRLRLFAWNTHDETMRFLESLTPDALDRLFVLPWSKMATAKLGFEVADHTLAETLVQVPAHSSHHRGQVCARLRELGVDPPMTDYIAWIWRHKPDPIR
ncbi:MAG: damage-inducible protein DinB [Chlorobiaceae bacterium]|nr:damage-inducible protein DinB [Chlorobiaceae bacterium]